MDYWEDEVIMARTNSPNGYLRRGHTYKKVDGVFELYCKGEFIARFARYGNMKRAASARLIKGATGRIRPCMCCNDNFYSDHIGVRLCTLCKAGNSEDE